ncbi:alcohol dehydrogenase [Aspergillus aurantiobrunneus]
MSLSGLWQPRIQLENLFYGTGCVQEHLLETIPKTGSKAFIITGKSLAEKSPLVRGLETLLGVHHAGTISYVRQHGPEDDVEQAVETILRSDGVDTLVSLGGGSPIDTAKVISMRIKERRGDTLKHLTIPTTLSAAECTAAGGYTKADGVKVGFRRPEMGVSTIFYDPVYARHTPRELWVSTGMRAMDHAVECLYHPTAAEVPWKALALWAAGELFELLPRAAKSHPQDDETSVRLMLAAYASSGLKGENVQGGMGLSHSLGHALGSPYGIPHGITSCLTLGKVVQLMARESSQNASQIARLLPVLGGNRTGNTSADALEVGSRISALVDMLGVDTRGLSSRGIQQQEREVIVDRALKGAIDSPFAKEVDKLVQSLF